MPVIVSERFQGNKKAGACAGFFVSGYFLALEDPGLLDDVQLLHLLDSGSAAFRAGQARQAQGGDQDQSTHNNSRGQRPDTKKESAENPGSVCQGSKKTLAGLAAVPARLVSL